MNALFDKEGRGTNRVAEKRGAARATYYVLKEQLPTP